MSKPDLTRFLDQADEVIEGVKKNEDCNDPQVFEYYISRLKILETAISRILLTYDVYLNKKSKTSIIVQVISIPCQVNNLCV